MMDTTSAMEDSGVDLPELLARVEYDRELLREIFEIFRQEFPPLNVALNEAVARNDLEEIRIAAHTITGMLASLSFTKATVTATRIGRMARESTPEGIPSEVLRMERNIAAAQAELELVCQEVIH
jgi:two-component system sensor histidine kinase/response regulator